MKGSLRKQLAKLTANPAELAKVLPSVCTLAHVAPVLAVRSGGVAITPEKRDELLEALAAGRYVEVEVDMLAYEQEAGKRNRNSVRFRDGAMMSLGRSGAGTPFLKDHDRWSMLSKGGSITSSRTDKLTEGHYQVHQTAKLTAPWAVELALRGLLDAVSIHWGYSGPVMCSACDAPIFTQCYHFPGDTLTEQDLGKAGKKLVRDPKGELVVEWIYTDAELRETSAVPIGGVPTAAVKDVRAALSEHVPALRAELAAGGNFDLDEIQEETTDMNPELLALLGLTDKATPDQVLAAVKKLQEDGQADKAELTIKSKDLESFKSDIDALKADQRKRNEDKFIDAALSTGRIGKGDVDTWRALYGADTKRATELMEKREPNSATPVGAPPQREDKPDPALGGSPRITGGTSHMRNMKKQLAKLQAQLAADPDAARFAIQWFGYEDRDGKLVNYEQLGATAIQNNAALDSARIGFHIALLEQLTIEDDQALSALFTEAPSTRKLEEWDWMGDLPDFEEWTTDRKLATLEGFKMRLANKDWASGIRLKQNDVADDNLGLLPAQIAELGNRAKFHKWDLMVKLLLNGFDGAAFPEVGDGLAYDDAFFFSDSHRGGNDNKLTLALDANGLAAARLQMRRFKTLDGKVPFRCKPSHLIVGPKLEETAEKLLTQDRLANGESNPNKGKYQLLVSDLIDGDFDDDWYLADLRGAIRPFIFQNREPISTSAIVGAKGSQNDSLPRFMSGDLLFGAEARYNVGYFEFRRIVGSRP